MPTEVRVLGSCGAWPEPGRACSGYLVEVFDLHELRQLSDGSIGPFRLSTAQTPHHVPNLAVRLSTPEATVVYTGDSGPLSRSDDPAGPVSGG